VEVPANAGEIKEVKESKQTGKVDVLTNNEQIFSGEPTLVDSLIY